VSIKNTYLANHAVILPLSREKILHRKGMTLLIFRFLARKIGYLGTKQPRRGAAPKLVHRPPPEEPTKIQKNLSLNVDLLKTALGNSNDVKVRPFRFGPGGNLNGILMFIDGLVDGSFITEAIVRPLVNWRVADEPLPSPDDGLMESLHLEVLYAGDIRVVDTLEGLASGCLSGDTILLVDGCETGLDISTKGWDKRGVTEPQSETVVRGPREGFTENLRTNTALVRRKIHDTHLRVEHLVVGHKTKTSVCIIYLEDVAKPEVVKAVQSRISRLDVDSILESGYIEEYIEDAPFSPFATVGYSEKPDVVAARILEGRVAIIVDGTPFVLTAPMLFVESFQTSEDYYARAVYASLTRLLRFVAYFMAVFAPAVFIALTAFHQELIPTTLLFTIANAREGTPFPVFIETSIMVFSFEILREAGIRLPRPVGQAISIVGALVMGEAAVSAGLVGAPVVITIALTAVATFLVPTQSDSASLLRIIMMVVASFAGWYGISIALLAVLIHLASLTSFGVPYFEGFAWNHDLQDTVIRMPLWAMVKRPRSLAGRDTTRRSFFIPPKEPQTKTDGDGSEGGPEAGKA